jgi:hypothetical protein
MFNNTTMLKPTHSTSDTPAACSEAYLLTKQNCITHFHRNLPVAGSTAAPRRLQPRGLHSPPSPSHHPIIADLTPLDPSNTQSSLSFNQKEPLLQYLAHARVALTHENNNQLKWSLIEKHKLPLITLLASDNHLLEPKCNLLRVY